MKSRLFSQCRLYALDCVSAAKFSFERVRLIDVPSPFKAITIDPWAVNKSLEPSRFVRSGRYRLSGQVFRGTWDRIIPLPEKHHLLAEAFRARFVRQTAEFSRMLAKYSDGADAYLQLERFIGSVPFDLYAQMFSSFRQTGFRAPGFGASRYDPFFICIDEDGAFLFTTGKHRLALAKAAGLKTIEARVSARHISWVRYRKDLRGRLKAGELSGLDMERRDHPDLQDIFGTDYGRAALQRSGSERP